MIWYQTGCLLDVSGLGVLEWLAVQDAFVKSYLMLSVHICAMFVKTQISCGHSALSRRISMRCQTGTENLSQAWPQERVACLWQRLVICVCCDLCFRAFWSMQAILFLFSVYRPIRLCWGAQNTHYSLVLRSALNCQQEPANPVWKYPRWAWCSIYRESVDHCSIIVLPSWTLTQSDAFCIFVRRWAKWQLSPEGAVQTGHFHEVLVRNGKWMETCRKSEISTCNPALSCVVQLHLPIFMDSAASPRSCIRTVSDVGMFPVSSSYCFSGSRSQSSVVRCSEM